MSNYYFPVQPALLKQSSQIITPLSLQQSNFTIIRSSHTDRNQQDSRNSNPLTMQAGVQSPQLSREGSFKHLLDSNRTGQTSIIQARSSGGTENPRTFSDYQINPTIRTQEQQLPAGGGYNISNKIGEKIKNRTDLHKSSSKANINSPEQRTPSIRYVESIIEGEKADISKIQGLIQTINSEMTKLSDRLNTQQERMDRIQKEVKKIEDINEKAFSKPQMQEINKILSLVEKSQQRDDYRKAIKMIEELRSAILDLNSEVKTLSDNQTDHTRKSNDEAFTSFKAQLLESISQKSKDLKKAAQLQAKELAKRISEMQEHWKHWKKEHESPSIISSVKKFEGKMTTLLYEQKITHLLQPTPSSLNTNITKTSSKIDFPSDKENNGVVMTSKTYYIDSNGYLLDKNKYYLLNQRSEQIRLTQKQIELLKKHNIL